MKQSLEINDSLTSRRAHLCRRAFLGRSISGLGTIALNSLLQRQLSGAELASRGIVNPLHPSARAKRVIFLYQAGGPSHLETFDSKPMLAKMHAKPMPESLTKGQQLAQLQSTRQLQCLGPQYEFKRFGKSGQTLCELFPQICSSA